MLEMPLAVNLDGTDWSKIPLNKGKLKGLWFAILAKLYEISRDKLERRVILKQKQKRRLRITLLSVFIFVLTADWASNHYCFS